MPNAAFFNFQMYVAHQYDIHLGYSLNDIVMITLSQLLWGNTSTWQRWVKIRVPGDSVTFGGRVLYGLKLNYSSKFMNFD